jgi:hypothetical protein
MFIRRPNILWLPVRRLGTKPDYPKGRATRLCKDLYTDIRERPFPETVWKVLRTGQTPHHEPTHRSVDKGLPSGAQPLVVLAHCAVVRDPGERSLYDSSTRQDPKTPRRHQPLPVHLLALLGPLLCPHLGHLLGEGLRGLAHHLHAEPQSLLGPPPAPPLVARASTHRWFRRESLACADSSSALSPSWSGTLALCILALSTIPSVSTSKWRFLPSTFSLLGRSRALCLPPP